MEFSSSLMSASVDGDIDRVTTLLDGNAPIDHQDDNGYTALHLAVVSKHADVVALLLRRGADPNIVDRYGNGPLWAAVIQGSVGIVESLLQAEAAPFQTNSAARSPVDAAREIGHGLETLFTEANCDHRRVNRPAYETVLCPDCGVEPSTLHEPFCSKERCPFCDGQLASCDCIFDVLSLNNEERVAIEEYVDDSVEPLRSITERWVIALENKGRISW